MLTANSCNLFESKQVFDDVYYTSNFIEPIGFGTFVGDEASVPATAVTGSWDMSYRYQDWDGYDYITLTDTGSTVSNFASADGLADAAPVYRLELVNLIDGGSFEIDESASWSVTTGTGAATGSAVWQKPSPLFGTGCMMLGADKGCTVTYSATKRAGAFSFNATSIYNVFFRYISTAYQIALAIDDSGQTLNKTGVDEKGYAKFTLNKGSGSAPVFAFSPVEDTFYNLDVDNFRVGRYGNMELRLYLMLNETTPALESGTYTFSVWVYTDPSAADSATPYFIDTFGIKMVPLSDTVFLSTTTALYSKADGWQKLTATLEPSALTFKDAFDPLLDPVIGLVLDFNQTRPGSVLLAQPELRFIPDGL